MQHNIHLYNDIAGGHHTDYGMLPSSQPQLLPETSTQRAPGAKRGRKPGPLPRAERQAQRKLNHSIIEKTRRAKINDALATLRELVPQDWQGHSTNGGGNGSGTSTSTSNHNNRGIQSSTHFDDRVDGADGSGSRGEDEDPSKQEKSKEKEFKLEILVRTVSYLQNLLERVKSLEAQDANGGSVSSGECSSCGHQASLRKKQHFRVPEADDDDDDDQGRVAMLHRRPHHDLSIDDGNDDVDMNLDDRFAPSHPHAGSHHRLPSISTWLRNLDSEHQCNNNRCCCCCCGLDDKGAAIGTGSLPDTMISPLPTPPSSTYFGPTQAPSSQVPPALNLNPLVSRGSSRNSHHPRFVSPLSILDNDNDSAVASSSSKQLRSRSALDSRGGPSLSGPGQANDFSTHHSRR